MLETLKPMERAHGACFVRPRALSKQEIVGNGQAGMVPPHDHLRLLGHDPQACV